MALPRALSHYVGNALASLSTPLAQLVFLAALRDPYTGRYLHEGWESVASPEEVHRALVDTHQDVFDSMGRLALATLCDELQLHFQSLLQPGHGVAKLWLEVEPFREMIPEGCTRLEREFFISQMKAALQILARAPHCTPEPGAWPPQPPGRRFQRHWEN